MALTHQVFTHHHVSVNRAADLPTTPNLISTHDRIIAVASSVSSVDFYDAENVWELQDVLGSGACKFKLLGSLHVKESRGEVEISVLSFLKGGTLAVLGKHIDGIVIHVYRLAFTAKASTKYPPNISTASTNTLYSTSDAPVSMPLSGPAMEFKTPIGIASATAFEMEILPQLVYRAAIPHIKTAQLFPFHARENCFSVILDGDNTIRFYEATAAEEAAAGARDACVGAVTTTSVISTANLSNTSNLLALASPAGEITVFKLVCDGKGNYKGEQIALLLGESPAKSLQFMRIPTANDANLYERFRYNDTILVAGCENGFLTVWWLGNREGSAPNKWASSSPLMDYPPFHASRGQISHLSASDITDDTAVTHSTSMPVTTALLCVGAQGARGWRVYAFDHIAPNDSASAWYGGATTAAIIKEKPNHVPGHYEWDNKGRKTYVPPAPRDVMHLLSPCVRCPTYAECLRAPIIGDASWPSHTGGSLARPVLGPHIDEAAFHAHEDASIASSESEAVYNAVVSGQTAFTTIPRLTAGVCPLGAAVIRYRDDGSTASEGSPALDRPVISKNSVFRLLARSGHGIASFSHAANLTGINQSSMPAAKLVQAPRVAFVLLTERGIHAAGFDYHEVVVADISPASRAAAALRRVQQREKAVETASALQLAVEQPVVSSTVSATPATISRTGIHGSCAPSGHEHDDELKHPTKSKYWPSAAVMTRVRGTRSTIFSTEKPQIKSSKNAHLNATAPPALPPNIKYLPRHTRERMLQKMNKEVSDEAGGAGLGRVVHLHGDILAQRSAPVEIVELSSTVSSLTDEDVLTAPSITDENARPQADADMAGLMTVLEATSPSRRSVKDHLAVTRPILRSSNLEDTVAFYASLGFTVKGIWPSEYLILTGPDCIELHFRHDPAANRASNDAACWVGYSSSESVQKRHTAWSNVNLPPTAALQAVDQSGPLVEFHLTDLHGNIVRVGAPKTAT